MSHAGLALLRELADRTGVTAGLSAALPSPQAGYDRGRVFADLMLRPGSAGSNTAADHLRLLREAIAALPPALRRRIMVTCDGAGASHGLVKELERLARRHGYQVTYSVGWALSARERAAIGKVPETAWESAIDAKGRSANGALLALDGDLAKAGPKTLRYRLLHAAARLVRGGRRRVLKIAATWPWTDEITTAWHRIQVIPHPP